MEDVREAQRLADKVDPQTWVTRYYAPYLSESHERILDVGCGPGVLSAEIAQRFPNISVCAIDASSERIKAAEALNPKLNNLNFYNQKAEQLTFDDNSFDLAYCRLMLEYSPSPVSVVKEMSRVCKPEGHIILQDLDGQLLWNYPEDTELQQSLETFLSETKKTGHDPFVGRKLFSIAKAAGLTSISVSIEPYHLYAGRIPDKEFEEWSLKLDIALPRAANIFGEQEAQALKKRFLEYLRDENTLTYSVLFTVIGQTPSMKEK